MKKYLDRICSGEHINMHSFVKACKSNKIDLQKIQSVFDLHPCLCGAKGMYFLKQKNEILFEQYFSRFCLEHNDLKVEAALRGNSKRGKINGGALHLLEHYQHTSGISLIFRNGDCEVPIAIKPNLLIVENLNLLLSLTPEDVYPLELDKYNIIWGHGNEVTNSQFTSFLNQYQRIDCFFDYDLAGVKMFQNLERATTCSVHFYQHPRLGELLEEFGISLKEKDYLTLFRYVGNKQSDPVIALMQKYGNWLEQEIIQALTLEV